MKNSSILPTPTDHNIASRQQRMNWCIQMMQEITTTIMMI